MFCWPPVYLAVGSSARANALLRLMTSARRLSVGKAPVLRGPRVNSEKGESTPGKEAARLLAPAHYWVEGPLEKPASFQRKV